MNSMTAFAMGKANRGKELMVFDWDKAAQLIKDSGVKYASAGLKFDWEWTGGEIFTDGMPTLEGDTYVYLASTWATPQLEIGGEIIDCYKMQSETDGWSSETYWPDSARTILSNG